GFIPGSKWRRAANAEAPAGVLKAQQIPPLKVMKTFHPVSIVPQRPHVYTIDFGQNFSGWAQIAVQGPRGASIRMLPSELLYPDGSADQRDSGSPYEFNYVLKGEGTEVWSPRFTYYGFRYLQIENIAVEGGQAADGLPVLISAEGQMIYPDIEASGSFMSSNPMLNKTHEIINWAILSNMKSVFTDCPHREKLCWLEQTHLMGPSLLYNYPVESLMLKVLEDIREAQLPSGLVPTTAPEYVVFDGKLSKYRHSVSWGAAYIMNCWNLFRTCGNTTVLTGHYTGMERYIRYLEANSEGFIIQDGLGDWYDIGENGPGYAQNTPIALPETAMFYQIVSVFARIAGELGREQDAERYRVLSQSIKNAYNRTFFNPATCQY
ncbi:family 78 glycoside hydrolase catalytic domain, partial [Paenibacillus sepulcri]|nr:family 78 glycoside hydrolase catalytic domain [Paenibacillus sepulcri]